MLSFRVRRRAGANLVLVALLIGSVGCGRKKDPEGVVALLSASQIYAQSLQQLDRNNLRKARSLLERIQYATDDRVELEPKVRLAIADSTFYQKFTIALIDARALYLDFVTLYGDSPLAPYAQFQAGMASLGQIRNPSKDQTQTRQAIADFQEVVRRYPNASFAGAAERTIISAETSLAEHEFLVGRFYMKRKKPLAAVARFQLILDRYPEYAEKDKLYFHLGRSLLRIDNDVEARLYLDKLIRDYPEGRYAQQARRELSRFEAPVAGDANGSP